MALPSNTSEQCHDICGPACEVDMKVIPHYLIVTLVLNLLGHEGNTPLPNCDFSFKSFRIMF